MVPPDGVESNVAEASSVSHQPTTAASITAERNTHERASLNLSVDPTDSSFVDKSEMALKRIAEKLIDYDMTPVAEALARHLGIDLSNDGIQARNRRGIAIIVHGPPGSGKATFSL